MNRYVSLFFFKTFSNNFTYNDPMIKMDDQASNKVAGMILNEEFLKEINSI